MFLQKPFLVNICFLCSSPNSMVKIYSYDEVGFGIKIQDIDFKKALICDCGSYDLFYFIY